MFNHTLFLALFFIVAGNIFTWFQVNLQFISDWWKERPMFAILFFSTPSGALFYYGWQFLVKYFDGNLWPPRLISFGVGIIIFAILAYIVKGEVIDNKTIICLFLSIVIILIQMHSVKSPNFNKTKDSVPQHDKK